MFGAHPGAGFVTLQVPLILVRNLPGEGRFC